MWDLLLGEEFNLTYTLVLVALVVAAYFYLFRSPPPPPPIKVRPLEVKPAAPVRAVKKPEVIPEDTVCFMQLHEITIILILDH